MTLRRRASALATSAALAASLAAVPTVGSTAWAGPAWEPSPLRVAHGDIVDSQDRTVLLRGTNVNQLVDYAVNDPALPTVVPLTRDDFAQMATLGFTVVRLNVSWSALEPRPGAFATGYVAKIRKAVRDAADHGMYTVLDMHQDAWGRAVGTPPDATCPPFMQRARGWDGAPAWATLTGGVTTCTLGGIREVSPPSRWRSRTSTTTRTASRATSCAPGRGWRPRWPANPASPGTTCSTNPTRACDRPEPRPRSSAASTAARSPRSARPRTRRARPGG